MSNGCQSPQAMAMFSRRAAYELKAVYTQAYRTTHLQALELMADGLRHVVKG